MNAKMRLLSPFPEKKKLSASKRAEPIAKFENAVKELKQARDECEIQFIMQTILESYV